jgi:hypothetical protein
MVSFGGAHRKVAIVSKRVKIFGNKYESGILQK